MISIVVPIYNVEKYLERCIESLINQTFTDIEIILVDDGSTDKPGEICNLYKYKDRRIRVIHKKNEGLSEARNEGIKIANGEYIAFLDSDDWVEIDMYEKLYNYINNENADIVQCRYEKVYNDNTRIGRNIKEEIEVYTGESILYHLYGNKYGKNIVVWNKIYKKHLFHGIKFPKGKCHEDEFITYKVLHKAKKIIDCNLPLVYYRQRKDSIMNCEFNIKRLDIIEAFKGRIEYYKQNKLFELEKQTEIQLFYALQDSYINIINSKSPCKDQLIKSLIKETKSNYRIFMKNSCISIKSKILMNIFILNQGTYSRIINRKYI